MCFLLSNVLPLLGQASLDLETGAVGTGYNNVRIPGDQMFFVAATYRFSDRFGIKAGYRMLEGGAEKDEVYSFALVN
jgi:hypothetical protein